jgi:hypothetical protein
VAVSSSVAVYNPPEAGSALDAVEEALKKIVSNPHLPAPQLAAAKKVVVDVESTVEFLESAKGKALSKEERGKKVMSAIKELQDLQTSWQSVTMTKVADKKANLLKKLKEKEAEMEKDKKMMKVLNLEKALAEKKLALENLVEQKQKKAKEEQEKEDTKELAKREEMISSVLKMAKDAQSSKAKSVSAADVAKLANVQSYLNGQMKTLSGKMKDLDEAEKKRTDMIKATVGGKAGNSDDKELKKSMAILNMLMKKEQRNYKKARATLDSEYKELDDAVKSIKKGDVAALSKVMSKWQSQTKDQEAKSHKFLY